MIFLNSKSLIMKNIFLIFSVLISASAIAQNQKMIIDDCKKSGTSYHSESMRTSCRGIMKMTAIDQDWHPILTHAESENNGPYDILLKQIKAEKLQLKKNGGQISSDAAQDNGGRTLSPTIGVNFIGNNDNGCPPDNTVAVSSDGKIISLVNSNIEYDDVSGTYYGGIDLVSFYNDPYLSTNICDPKIIYDSGADRFIFYAQTCDADPNTSVVIIAFSQTNDPYNGSWYYYEFTGNPMNDDSWFDYPKVAVSTDELFVTGNLFYGNGNYNQSVVYQIDKNQGYDGASITWQYWSGIDGDPFTLLPVSWGHQGNYGPGIYLVSVNSSGSSSIDFYDLTDNQYAANEELDHYSVSTDAYSPGGDASQNGTNEILNIGDSRTQSGFYLDGIVHFVFTSDIGNGWNGINYNRLDVAALTNTSTTFGLVGTYDYCYPSVASFASGSNDKSVVVAFERSGSSIFPETRVVSCDNAGDWSSSVSVKAGDSYISQCYDPNFSSQRWGDYTGISRKHNSNRVWVSGGYGGTSNFWETWIAEVIPDNAVSTETIHQTQSKPVVFPNPVTDLFRTTFYLRESGSISIDICNESGAIIKQLFSGYAWRGENNFSFNAARLSSGNYFLIIKCNQQIVSNEKVSIVR